MMTPTLEISGLAPSPATQRDTASSVTVACVPPASRSALPPGTRMGRYVVISLLGRGGMGSVYLGHDPILDRPVALKVSHHGAEAAPHMAREACMLAQISDPHVVQVYDVGRIDGATFVAMELVQGRTLCDWLREAPRSREEVLDVFAQAGQGLAALHRAGLVHRDFKPANVMVGDDGRVRVLDLGVAVDAGTNTSTRASYDGSLESTRLTPTGTVVGTPAYMAPEQHLGGTIDERADQFAFCLALFEALAGHRPFEGKTVRELEGQKLAGRMTPPRQRMPRRVRRAVLRGLAADRQQRWPSMGNLLGALA